MEGAVILKTLSWVFRVTKSFHREGMEEQGRMGRKVTCHVGSLSSRVFLLFSFSDQHTVMNLDLLEASCCSSLDRSLFCKSNLITVCMLHVADAQN